MTHGAGSQRAYSRSISSSRRRSLDSVDIDSRTAAERPTRAAAAAAAAAFDVLGIDECVQLRFGTNGNGKPMHSGTGDDTAGVCVCVVCAVCRTGSGSVCVRSVCRSAERRLRPTGRRNVVVVVELV